MRDARLLLEEILAAIAHVAEYTEGIEADELEDDQLRYDAVRYNLLVIGEAVKQLPDDLLGLHPEVPWDQIARLRDRLAHRYYETQAAIIHRIARHDLTDLAAATGRLPARVSDDQA